MAIAKDTLVMELKQDRIEKPVQMLYERYCADMVAWVQQQGGSRDDGADIFQEAVLVLIQKIQQGQFREESSIRTYLMAIVKNLWLFELRTRDRRKKREKMYQAADPDIIQPAERPFSKQAQINLFDLLNVLGETCRKILTGVYAENKSMSQLLQEVSFENEQVLRNKKSKCMKKLREHLSMQPAMIEQLKNQYTHDSGYQD